MDQASCRDESIVHYYPSTLLVHHNYNGKTVLKLTSTLDLSFLYFSGETHKKVTAFLPAEVTRKYLQDARAEEEEKRNRQVTQSSTCNLAELFRQRKSCMLS